ncbi:DNA polymerase III subunit gamma/tau C-terminal domain-containing protein, partial [Coralloluteibacterium stylophorae]
DAPPRAAVPDPAGRAPERAVAEPEPAPAPPVAARAAVRLRGNDDWLDLLERCPVRGPARELAAHSSLIGFEHGVLRLSIPPADEYLVGDRLVRQFADCLAEELGQAPQIRFEIAEPAGEVETMHLRTQRQAGERQEQAERDFMADGTVQRLIQHYGAAVVPGSIAPIQSDAHPHEN